MASSNGPNGRPSSPISARRFAQNAKKRLNRMFKDRRGSASTDPSSLTMENFQPPGIQFHGDLLARLPVDRQATNDDFGRICAEASKTPDFGKKNPVRLILMANEVLLTEQATNKMIVTVTPQRIARVLGSSTTGIKTTVAFTASDQNRHAPATPSIRRLYVLKSPEAETIFYTLKRLITLNSTAAPAVPTTRRPRSMALPPDIPPAYQAQRSGSNPVSLTSRGRGRPPLPPLPPLPPGAAPVSFQLSGASLGATADHSDSSDDDCEIASMGSEDEIASMGSEDERDAVRAAASVSPDLSKFEFHPSEAWACPSCQHHNHAVTVDQCAKCGALRPEALGLELNRDARPSIATSTEGQYIVNEQLYSSVVPSRRMSMLTNASEMASEPASVLASPQGSTLNLVPPPLPPRSKSQLSMDPLVEALDETSARPSVDVNPDVDPFSSSDVAQDRVQAADGSVQAGLATRPRLHNPFSEPLSPGGTEVRRPSALRNAVSSTGAAPQSPSGEQRSSTAQQDVFEATTLEASKPSNVKDIKIADKPVGKASSGVKVTLHESNPFAMFETDV
eukprot:m.130691 g.130691  ORF g.130691 m.130691 type:complete len:564 (-) comp15882_c0_seq5:59-1750(-)